MKKILFLSFFLVIAVCQTIHDMQSVPSGAADLAIELTPFENNRQIDGKVAQAIMLGGTMYWLLTSERDGILLVDSSGKLLSQIPGNMEVLDWRNHVAVAGETLGMIATVDNESGELLLITLNSHTMQLDLRARLDYGNAALEGLCWYLMPEGHLSLFTLDTLGNIEQRILVDARRGELTNMSLRQFVGAPEAESCSVDDDRGTLYVAEPTAGVWQYSADPESKVERELVLALHPFGQAHGDVTYVDVLDSGAILVSAPYQQGVWYVSHQEPAVFVNLGALAAESVTALEHNGVLHLGVYDDSQAAYYFGEMGGFESVAATPSESMESLSPYAETSPVENFGDAADDPAIWVNRRDPTLSRVLGTDKKQGLMQYDLQGNLLQSLNVGRVNNVDLRYGFDFNGRLIDIAAASNRTTKSISLFAIDPVNGSMTWINDVPTNLADIYGLCLYQDRGRYYVFANATDGRFQQYMLSAEKETIGATLVREFLVASQPEGCVVDDERHQLFFGEEARGIWQVSAKPTDNSPKLIAEIGDHFVADVEGLAIYHGDKERLLIASSQGNNSYAVFALDQDNRYIGSFRVGMNLAGGIDGASETDGLAIVSAALGPQLPDGLLVVQDGHNVLPLEPQNFKFISAAHVVRLVDSLKRQ